MNSFKASYDKILEVLSLVEEKDRFLKQIRLPKLSDKELIAMNLTAEYLGIDSEYELFRKLPLDLSSKIDRTVYNRRKRKLGFYINELRLKLAERFNEYEDYFVIDSMPLEVCKLSRSVRSKICKETDYTYPDKGYCAAQGMHYYGYKLHAVCSVDGVFQSVDLSPASVHDIHFLKDINTQLSDCVLIGDKGYLSAQIQLNLFETASIQLETPKRKNQKDYKPQAYIYKKKRKRIETLFSQLCDQFMIRRNYAKTFEGFKTRILSKITALTVIQFINKQFNRNINNLKVSIT